ncbi:hypothetical protein SEA_INDYLU_27 [Microbacterium phage IndyLu]|uniref:hypothetical protein n=1 Tax=Microbacterium phage IndyLu TaxID=2885152 RepID=UPI001E6D6E3E|nr:hypothetical protein QDW27_gp27 [Microbacterium phage IndyLu]UDG78729.1 hypothetical protein SEA_INDYLU_27 [Microbacterium phage IndyLu]
MTSPILPDEKIRVLTAAIQDMSFNPWQARPEDHPGETPPQIYNKQRNFWMAQINEHEPWNLGIFAENYPPRADLVDGMAVGVGEPTEEGLTPAPTLTQENHLSEHGLPLDVAEYVRARREQGVEVKVVNVPAPDLTKRETILREANRIIHGDRQQDYGPPVDSFTRLAEALNLVLRPKLREGVELDAVDAAVLMIAMKLSRLAGGDRKDDTWVDLAGYSALGAEIRDAL